MGRAAADFKHIAQELLARVIWALKYMDVKGGGMVTETSPDGKVSMKHWITWFSEATAICGLVIDQKALREQRKGLTKKPTTKPPPQARTRKGTKGKL